jgi:hypothetical protein
MSLIINDLHFGVKRTGGTTPQSQQELRQYLLDSVKALIARVDGEVTVNGDCFDGFTVDTYDMIKVYELFSDWLHDDSSRKLNMIQGNHDANPRGDKVSSFHLLCHFLKARFDDRVSVFDNGYAHISKGVSCIPHCANQEIFNIEVAKAVADRENAGHLLLHCNYKNGFAENSDHSLNLGDDQVGALIKAGWNLVLGHEHVGYELRGGKVVVVGNQFSSSVSDCLGNDKKFAVRIENGVLSRIETWWAKESFTRAEWQDLGELVSTGLQFIRVEGEATASQAAEAVSAIAKFRQRSTAFVITNAVKVEGMVAADEMAADSIESIKAFDVLGAIFENLEPREVEVVKGLIE